MPTLPPVKWPTEEARLRAVAKARRVAGYLRSEGVPCREDRWGRVALDRGAAEALVRLLRGHRKRASWRVPWRRGRG